jgi:hypothetical protein
MKWPRLGFQALTRNPQDRELLSRDNQKYLAKVLVDYIPFRLRKDPGDARSHTRPAPFPFFQGKAIEALDHLKSGLEGSSTGTQPNRQNADLVGVRFSVCEKRRRAI